MHRALLIAMLDAHSRKFPEREDLVERFRSFVRARADCLERSCLDGHVTASAWVVDPAAARAVLLRHRKLGKWLQPGGHVDGDPRAVRAAAREVREETGIVGLSVAAIHSEVVPVDLDIHEIPRRGSEPSHLHFDVRFLMRASSDRLIAGSEADAIRWCDREEVRALTQEPSVLRLAETAEKWNEACAWIPV
ncbi:MAG: NUDIX hydrolase [Planctomycetota bacterium]